MYVPGRPLMSALNQRRIGREYRHPRLRYVLPPRGMPLETRRGWLNRHHRIAGSTLLVQGTGTGWDVVSWAAHRPSRIYAVDLYAFEEWPEIAALVRSKFGVEVMFVQAPLEDVGLDPCSVDLVVSDAVFEHCTDLPAVLQETRRVLRGGGHVYASYGPLWYCAGGDHFSGRGGPDTVFNHVRLPADAYREYFLRERRTVEDFQSGGRYVELDLFSKLTTRRYFAAFEDAGFELRSLILEVSDESLRYRQHHPGDFAAMVASHPGTTEDDFLVKANLVVLGIQ